MSSSENPFIGPTLVLQDLERLKFSQNLRQNPAEYSAYVNQRINEMTDEVFNRKRTAFQKAHIDLGRYMDMDHNANFYKIRASDVDRLTSAIQQSNNSLQQKVDYDRDISKRQFEINEWYNYNKLEFLFFLQLFFIATLAMVVIIYLQKTAAVTNQMAGLLTGLLILIVGGTGIYRYRYTKRTRDPRLWHRRDFGRATEPTPAAKCDPSGKVVVDLNSVLSKQFTQCADEQSVRFNNWQTTLSKEIEDYQQTGATPARLTGDKTLLGQVCAAADS